MFRNRLKFPLVDAYLIIPMQGKGGDVGICTNATAPGQVLNEIDEKFRRNVSVLGSLIVNRDGSERMIVNSLAHPTLKYLILFSEESSSFSPSTNLLLALQNGIDPRKSNNIVKGKGASAHYPNISKKILDIFRNQITVLPIFTHQNNYSQRIISNYLEWLKPKINRKIYLFIKEINNQKIYYDSLNQLIESTQELSDKKKKRISLDFKEFQHLQPPIINIRKKDVKPKVSFRVSAENKQIRLDIKIKNKTYFIKGENEFLLEYSLMKFLAGNKKLFSPIEQLLLGAEISRIQTQLKNKITFPSFVKSPKIRGKKEILLEPKVNLVPDKEYYYRIETKDGLITVACLSFDVCKEVFELRSKGLYGILEWLAKKNRFENYQMDILHRMDIGGQVARATMAINFECSFIQDFPYIFKENNKKLPFFVIEGDNFLDIHKNLLREIYTAGITEEHGDRHKGLTRTAVALAVYRNPQQVLKSMPAIYQQGELKTSQLRKSYKKQLLMFQQDGAYGYGERTRAHFGFDQLDKTIKLLRENPQRAAIIQRFNPIKDMGSYLDEETGQLKYTHDPCLTHDIFFIKDKKLCSFHIARIQNAVNAYPENIFGLYDAYVSTVERRLGLELGDMYMFSSRANILLLTEEQRTKRILSEPSKPIGQVESISGPYQLGRNIKLPREIGGVAYIKTKLKKITSQPKSEIINRLENFEGVNTIERAINYLKQKGGAHNNPILTQYQPAKLDAQGDYLVFFQANVFGNKVQANAVFVNHSINNIKKDKKAIDYIATQYSKSLKYPLGDLNMFYVAYVK